MVKSRILKNMHCRQMGSSPLQIFGDVELFPERHVLVRLVIQ